MHAVTVISGVVAAKLCSREVVMDDKIPYHNAKKKCKVQ